MIGVVVIYLIENGFKIEFITPVNIKKQTDSMMPPASIANPSTPTISPLLHFSHSRLYDRNLLKMIRSYCPKHVERAYELAEKFHAVKFDESSELRDFLIANTNEKMGVDEVTRVLMVGLFSERLERWFPQSTRQMYRREVVKAFQLTNSYYVADE